MTKEIEPADSVENYLQHKLGISQSLANAFLRAVTEFISLKLRRREQAILPYIGKIFLKITPKAKKMHFYPGQSLKNRINEELAKESTFLASLFALRAKRGIQQNKDNKEQIKKIEEELRTERKIQLKDQRDCLRYNLIYYLQRHYPHQASWEHPVTHKNYQWEDIHKALCLIKRSSGRDYRVLLTTLIRIDDRRYILKRWGLTKALYHKRLQQSLDAILMLLEFPEMSQGELDSILGDSEDKFKL